MSYPYENKSKKILAVSTSATLYLVFAATCSVVLAIEDKNLTATSLAVLLSVFIVNHISVYLFNKAFIREAYKRPIYEIKKWLLNKDNGIFNGESFDHNDNFQDLVLLIKNKVETISACSFEENIIKNSPNPLVVINQKNNIVFANPAFDTLFTQTNKTDEAIGLQSLLSMYCEERVSKDLIRIKENNDIEHTYQKKISKLKQKNQNYTIIEFQNVDEVVSLKARLDDRFKTDELTSLNTRFHFNDMVDEIIPSSEEGSSNYLALIDINDFKILNDSAGHDVGDLILMELANIVRSHADDDDLIGRISGDEFAILFRNKGLTFIEERLVNLYKSIKSYRIEHFDTQIGVSVSIGVTRAEGGDNFIGVRNLLQQADFAVMTAKKNGFMFKVYDEKDTDIVFYREAPVWINRIKKAISHNTFELFVQEITPFNEDKDLHLEVLLRMKNEKGGHYSPVQFLTVAEKFNLTKQIDEWVVVNTFKSIVDGRMPNCRVSINLSGDTIKDKLSVDRILYYADFHKIDPTKVVFEITETMAIDDLNQAISNINTLRIAGFSIALDDFGSGFSTFKYIQNIPADYIKIDGIFVKNAARNERDRAIVSNIVSIAHELGMACVAEFVEDEVTMRLMESLGVDYIQGYYVHKPVSSNLWLKNQRHQSLRLSA